MKENVFILLFHDVTANESTVINNNMNEVNYYVLYKDLRQYLEKIYTKNCLHKVNFY